MIVSRLSIVALSEFSGGISLSYLILGFLWLSYLSIKKKICKSLRGCASFHSNCKCLSDRLPVIARDWSSGWDYLCSSHWGLENLTSGFGKGWREGINWLGSGKKSPPTPITFHWTRTELHILEIVFNFVSRRSYHGLSLARFQGPEIFLKG